MNKKYILVIALAMILATGALFLPDKQFTKELSPDKLFFKINNPSRFISTDIIAKKIIDGDPALQLIDVRSSDQYKAYSLPGALNLPLKELMDSSGNISDEWIDYLEVDGMSTIFFSNGDICADQVWILCTRLGLKNMYVMKGGLNMWVETILKPQRPAESASSDEFALFDFRKGASQYFRGGSLVIESEVAAEPVLQVRKKKKTVVEGGC